MLVPQHFTPPAWVRAQVWYVPDVRARTPDPRPTTPTGLLLDFLDPLPSCPYSFDPQHLTPPVLVMAQKCSPPADSVARALPAATAEIEAVGPLVMGADVPGPVLRVGPATGTPPPLWTITAPPAIAATTMTVAAPKSSPLVLDLPRRLWTVSTAGGDAAELAKSSDDRLWVGLAAGKVEIDGPAASRWGVRSNVACSGSTSDEPPTVSLCGAPGAGFDFLLSAAGGDGVMTVANRASWRGIPF